MRRVILMGCLSLLYIATYAQSNGRVRSGTPLRWAMNGSAEIMEGDLTKYYGSSDSAINRINRNTVVKAPGGNLHATRFTSTQAQCNNNSMLLMWTAIQQYDTERYEVEQSTDGGNRWAIIGTVPASQTDLRNAAYTFNYFKDVSNVLFRVVAVSLGNERLVSSTFESPCSSNTYFGATPNPVYSTTTVRIGAQSATRVRMQLANTSGIVVYAQDASLLQGMNNVPIDMNSLQKGYYTLAIVWPNGKQETLNLVKN